MYPTKVSIANIDGDESKLYDSIADAKRVVRGEQPHYEIN